MSYNIEIDELFFLQYPFHRYHYDMTEEHQEAINTRLAFMYNITPTDVANILHIIDDRWIKEVPNPIFALRLAGFYFRVLVEMAHALAWQVYQDKNRAISQIRWIESWNFTYRDINKNGSEDVEDWTFKDIDYTLTDFIQIENEKGNMTNIFGVKDDQLPIHQIVEPEFHAALKMIAERFPENEISDNHDY